jgi:hypothetical protein
MLMDVGGPAITTPHEPTPMALSLSAAPYTPLLPMNQSAMAVSVSPAALQAKEAPTPDVAILPPPPPPVKPSSPRVRLISSVAPPCSPSAGGPPIRQSKRRRTQRSTVAARRPRAADQPLFAAIEHTAAHISFTVFDAHGRTVATTIGVVPRAKGGQSSARLPPYPRFKRASKAPWRCCRPLAIVSMLSNLLAFRPMARLW